MALDAVDWAVEPGEVHCLVGENGSGKSTLIKIMAGVHAPEPGGRSRSTASDVENLTPRARQGARHPGHLPGPVAVPQPHGRGEHRDRLRSSAALARPVRRARDARDRAGGARAPRLRAAARGAGRRACRSPSARSSPSAAASPPRRGSCSWTSRPPRSPGTEVNRLLAIVGRLKAQGIAVVFVIHRLDEVVEIAERVTVMRDGRKVGTYPAAEVDQRRLGELMTGLEIEHRIVARDLGDAAPLLEVERLDPRRRVRGRLLRDRSAARSWA